METQVKETLADEIMANDSIREIVYRTGQAEVIRDPKSISISGDIETVARFLEKRKEAGYELQRVKLDRAIVLVDV